MLFQNRVWNFFKLLWTAVIYASKEGHTEIVIMLVEHEGIDTNAKDIWLLLLEFIPIIWCFSIIFGNYANYYVYLLYEPLWMII